MHKFNFYLYRSYTIIFIYLALNFIALNANVEEFSLTSKIQSLQNQSQIICENLCAKRIDKLHWKISWQNNLEEECIYHVFASNHWQDLMPLLGTNHFIESPISESSFLFSTKDNTIHVCNNSYLRIVVQRDGHFSDVAPLITLEQPEDGRFLLSSSMRAQVDSFKKVSKYRFIPEDVLEQVKPYLIPNDHKAKAILDKIFSKNNKALSSIESFKKAGFEVLVSRRSRRIIIAKHPKLPKYIIKAYLDGNPHAEWPLWIARAKGAQLVNKIIAQNEYKKFLKCPKKWIYPIPRSSSDIKKPFVKHFILLVEDMKLVNEEENVNKFEHDINHSFMLALYRTLDQAGYSDCHIKNTPFCKDGKIALVDIEHTNVWPVHFRMLTPYFSPKMQKYWKRLMDGKPYLIIDKGP